MSKSAPTSASTIELFKDIFSVHGLPEIIVSDNATIFTSSEFVKFCETNGIFRRLIASGRPQTNDQAERYVQFVKRKLDAMKSENGSMQSKIQEILFLYRATPLRCDKIPAELYLGRQIRTRLDLLRPSKPPDSKKYSCLSLRSCLRSFSVGDRVLVKMFTSGKDTWKLGVIFETFGKLHYSVKLDDSYILKRHVDQLRQSEITRRVTFANPPDEYPLVREQPVANPFTRGCSPTRNPTVTVIPSQTSVIQQRSNVPPVGEVRPPPPENVTVPKPPPVA